jgi:hypothetical protein
LEDTAARLGLTDRQTKLTKVLLGEDALGVIIRAHIHIEHELLEFIAARRFRPAISDARSTYSARVQLALKLGLPTQFEPALKFVGWLRNRFAHQPDATIEQRDAEDFEKALGFEAMAAVDHAYNGTRGKLAAHAWTGPIAQLAPNDRIILYFVTLWAGIAVAAAKSKGVGA